MQSIKERNRKAKLKQRIYRRENPEKELAYNRTPKRAAAIRNRVKVRRELKKKMGAKINGKDIHHVDGNTNHNMMSNLKLVKRYHSGNKQVGKGKYKAKKR